VHRAIAGTSRDRADVDAKTRKEAEKSSMRTRRKIPEHPSGGEAGNSADDVVIEARPSRLSLGATFHAEKHKKRAQLEQQNDRVKHRIIDSIRVNDVDRISASKSAATRETSSPANFADGGSRLASIAAGPDYYRPTVQDMEWEEEEDALKESRFARAPDSASSATTARRSGGPAASAIAAPLSSRSSVRLKTFQQVHGMVRADDSQHHQKKRQKTKATAAQTATSSTQSEPKDEEKMKEVDTSPQPQSRQRNGLNAAPPAPSRPDKTTGALLTIPLGASHSEIVNGPGKGRKRLRKKTRSKQKNIRNDNRAISLKPGGADYVPKYSRHGAPKWVVDTSGSERAPASHEPSNTS